ncbi:MAG: HPr family phosphocarrier protein [Planctomycetota bacterium]
MSAIENEGLISEEEFLPYINEITEEFFKLLNMITGKPTKDWTKLYYSTLSEKAHTLESQLDDYHSRYNKTYSYFTELFALIKWFGYSGFLQKHILVRFSRYSLDIPDELRDEFVKESKKTLKYIDKSILSLIEQLGKEAKKLKLNVPSGKSTELINVDPSERRMLPQNIDYEGVVDQKHIIAELATLYKNLCESFKKIKITRDVETESIKSQTFYEFDETKTRQFESQIHNIQSKYDTYMKSTVIESQNPSLGYLRGHASISLHLFEMATILVHFYERHEDDIRYETTKEKTSSLIPKKDLLEVLNGYVRYFGIKLFLEGEKHADEIIRTFITIECLEIKTEEGFPIHARPLSLIAKIALRYNTPLEIEIDGNRCNAASIMQMILLAGKSPNPKLIRFRGEDRVLKDVSDLFYSVLLKDKDLQDAPPHLKYLGQ